MSGSETSRGLKWKSEYPIQDIHQVALRSIDGPEALVDFTDENGKQRLVLRGFPVLENAHEFLNECHKIRIIDRNSAEGNSLEFNRWRIEIWDEDNPYCSFNCDAFEVMQFDERNRISIAARISVRTATPMPSRPCDYCLALQDDSVFADFSLDEEGRIYLRRISYDGFGCNSGIGKVGKMSVADSQVFVRAVQSNEVNDPQMLALLLNYFSSNSRILWADALEEHALVSAPEYETD